MRLRFGAHASCGGSPTLHGRCRLALRSTVAHTHTLAVSRLRASINVHATVFNTVVACIRLSLPMQAGVEDLIKSLDRAKLLKAKLMFAGKGRAGKTSTYKVRGLPPRACSTCHAAGQRQRVRGRGGSTHHQQQRLHALA